MSLIDKLIVNDLHLQLVYEDNSIMCETSHKLEHFSPLNSFWRWSMRSSLLDNVNQFTGI